MPAKAGTQSMSWAPVFTGVTSTNFRRNDGMKKRWITGLALIGGALYLFANAGFRDLVSRTREQRRLGRVLIQLRDDHETLTREWARIQQDRSYTEYLIRKNLGYVKKGEVEYQILKKEK